MCAMTLVRRKKNLLPAHKEVIHPAVEVTPFTLEIKSTSTNSNQKDN